MPTVLPSKQLDPMEKNIFTYEQQEYIAKGLRALFGSQPMEDYFDEGVLEWEPRAFASELIAKLACDYVSNGRRLTTVDHEEYTEVNSTRFSYFETLLEAINILGNERLLKAAHEAGKKATVTA